ncbi:MAG: hypothetical protein ABR535_02095 [Pyrinomonadaceae bacterium]
MNKLQCFLLVGVIGFGAIVSCSQDAGRLRESAEVKAAVSALDLKKRPSVDIIRRNLFSLSGVVTSVGEDVFLVRVKSKTSDLEFSIRYADVLEVIGSGIHLSFVPDPLAKNHGSWAHVAGLGTQGQIGVVLRNGKEMVGYFGGADEEKLTLVGNRLDAVLDIPRKMIVRVFGVTDGKAGVKEYTRKGLKGGSEVGAPEALVVMPVAAGVGSLIGLAKQKKRRVILVFAE